MRTRSAFYVFSLLLFVLSPRAALSGTTASQARSVQEALSVPLGTNVFLKGVFVDKAISKPPYIVVREPWAAEERIVVLLSGAPGVSLQQTVDVTGSVTLLPNGYRAIEKAGIFAYTDRTGKVIKCPLPPGPPADSTVDITPAPSVSIARSDMSLMTEETPPSPDPGPEPTGPDYVVGTIAELATIPDGSTVRINGKPVRTTGTDCTYGAYFIAGEDNSADTLKAFSAVTASTDMRVASVQGTLSTSGSNRILSVDTGPVGPPTGFQPSALLAQEVTISGAKTQPNGAEVTLNGKIVSRAFPDDNAYYIQETGRHSGIKVVDSLNAAQLTPGIVINITGIMNTDGAGERFVLASAAEATDSTMPPVPLTMINRSVGGEDWFYDQGTGVGQKGAANCAGLNNIGLLIRTTGKVTQAGPGHVYINDGSPTEETTQPLDIRVEGTVSASVLVGDFVSVAGISSLTTEGTTTPPARLIRLGNENDIDPLCPPAAPTALQAVTTGNGELTLYWTESPHAIGYNVYRGTTEGGEDYDHPVTGTSPAPSYAGSHTYVFRDTGQGLGGLTNGSPYYYAVKAISACGGESAATQEVTASPNSDGIPWSSGTPEQILAAYRAAFPEESIADDTLRVVGPDGVAYEDGNSLSVPPDYVINPDTNEIEFFNGPVIPVPSDAPVGGIIPLATLPNAHTGPYRGVFTKQSSSYRGVMCDVQLPPTLLMQITPYTYPSRYDVVDRRTGVLRHVSTGDIPDIYLGTIGIDAGLQWSPVLHNWQPFIAYNPGSGTEYIGRTVNIPRSFGGRAQAGDLVTMNFYISTKVDGLVRLTVLSNAGMSITLGEHTNLPRNVQGVRVKRIHSIAQTLPRGSTDRVVGYRRTGSYLLDASVSNAKVRNSNFTLGRWGLAQTGRNDQGGFPNDTGIVNWFNDPNPFTQFPWEWETDISLDLD